MSSTGPPSRRLRMTEKDLYVGGLTETGRLFSGFQLSPMVHVWFADYRVRGRMPSPKDVRAAISSD